MKKTVLARTLAFVMPAAVFAAGCTSPIASPTPTPSASTTATPTTSASNDRALKVGQFREAIPDTKPVIDVLPEQDKIRFHTIAPFIHRFLKL